MCVDEEDHDSFVSGAPEAHQAQLSRTCPGVLMPNGGLWVQNGSVLIRMENKINGKGTIVLLAIIVSSVSVRLYASF
jgi:hypothetical protein